MKQTVARLGARLGARFGARFGFKVVASVVLVLAGPACSAAGNNSCGEAGQPSTYQQQPGDTSTTTRLDVSRPFPSAGDLQVNVCSGELRVEPAPRGDRLRVTAAASGAELPLARYLQDFNVSGGHAVVNLRTPKELHAVVTVFVPSAPALRSQVNLGAGTLVFHAGGLPGDRQLNVGAGTARLLLEGDRDYATLEANVGVGMMEDRRPSGENSYGLVSRSMQGKGRGDLQLNVGAGKVVLEPEGE